MRAAVLADVKKPLVIENRGQPVPADGEVLVRLKAAALNRRDFWITQGLYPGIQTGVIQGSDGAGIVEAVGSVADDDWVGKEVVINPGLLWGDDPQVQSEQFHILGMPADGTLAETIVVPTSAVFEKPVHLDWEQAAALPLAGVTAFRAVRRAGISEGSLVLINGIGGGVALMAMQLSLAMGATVLVTSSSQEKIEQVVKLGATDGFRYTESDWVKELERKYGLVDAVVDGAGGMGYRHLLQLAAPGGRIVNYGATAGPPEKIDLFKLFWKQLQLIGSTMGSPEDFREMLNFVCQHQITPVVDSVHALEDVNKALAILRDSSQFGKLVVSLV